VGAASAPLDADDADVLPIAGDVADDVTTFYDTGLDSFVPTITSSTTAAIAPTDLLLTLIDRYVADNDGQRTLNPTGITVSESCDLQGSLTYTAEGNAELISFNNCWEGVPSSYLILNGTLYASGTETGIGCGYSASGTLVFAGLSVESSDSAVPTLGIEGTMNFSVTGDAGCSSRSFRMTGTAWRLTAGTDSLAYYDFDILSSVNGTRCSVDYAAQVDASMLAGSLVIDTTTPVEGDCFATYPDTGVIDVNGAGGDSILITINSAGASDPNAVTISADVDGTPGVDAGYPMDFAWNDL
jgi:hypothetical protein